MKRLLVVKLSSFGDVLHALPVIKSIKNDLPDLSIGWVVRKRCAGLVQDCGFIDNIHIVEDKPGLGDLMKLRSDLRREKYDTAFDMQGLFLSGMITALSGAKRRVGLNRNRELNAAFLTEADVEGKKPITHAIDVQLGFRRSAGLGPVSDLPSLSHLGSGSDSWYAGVVPSEESTPVVVLNVGASTIYKRWPIDRWIELANAVTSAGARVILTAGPSEADDAFEIAGRISPSALLTNLGGKTTPDQLASVLSHSDVVITGDTGPMHLAAALGKTVIALFGPTDPRLTGPYGNNHKVIWKQISCSPCFRHPTCGGRVDCLTSITADEVFRALCDVLSERKNCSAIA